MKRSRQDLRRTLEAFAFNQSGYFTAAQALTSGYSYQAQKYHVDAGNWIRVDRGLLRLPNWPTEPDDQYVQWTLWSQGKGIISHESALRVHNLSDVEPSTINLTVPPDFRAKAPMVTTHPGKISIEYTERRRAWSVTTPLQTLADVATGSLSQEHINRAVIDALEYGLVTRRALLRRTADLPDRPALRLERAVALSDDLHVH